MPAMERQLGRLPAALQGKMLAPRNGDTRFCRQWGANLGGARAAFSCFFGPGLVHKSPQNLVLSFPLHQVSGPFRRSAGADLVHRPPQGLVLSSPLHQVSGTFQRSAGNGAPTRPASDYRPALGGKFPAGALKAEKENGRGHSPFPLSLNRKLPAGRRKLTNCYSYAVYRSSRYLYRSSASFMYCDAPENIFDKLNQ